MAGVSSLFPSLRLTRRLVRGAHTVRSPPTGDTCLPEAGGGEEAGCGAQSLSPGAPREECGVLVLGAATWHQVSVSCGGPRMATSPCRGALPCGRFPRNSVCYQKASWSALNAQLLVLESASKRA